MSTTVVTYPIVAALVEAEKILGPARNWSPVNETQVRFLKEFFDVCRRERIPEIESLVSWNAAELVAFLARHNFEIEIVPFSKLQFGTASVLDLLVLWAEPGSVVTILKQQSAKESAPPPRGLFERMKTALIPHRETNAPPPRESHSAQTVGGILLEQRKAAGIVFLDARTQPPDGYPAVWIDARYVSFYRARGHKQPVASPKTKSQDRVYMTMLDEPPSGFDLIRKAQELAQALEPADEFGGLVFPMVHLDQCVDADWLVGMKDNEFPDGPAEVATAHQQIRLRMNELGARAESAVVLGFVTGPPRPLHVINRPFLIWFEREGLLKPLFVGHITEENWKNPGDISR